MIQPHPLLKEAGQGGFLDIPRYANSDFTRTPDALVARIKVELVPEPSTLLGLGFFSIAGTFLQLGKDKKNS